MSQIHAVVTVKAKAGSEDLVRTTLEDTTAAAQNDHGVVAYATYPSVSEPGVFVTIEKWTSQADFDAHVATPMVRETVAKLDGHLDGAPTIQILGPAFGS